VFTRFVNHWITVLGAEIVCSVNARGIFLIG
jgi:hypothetical protein